ncbi:MAG: amino acid permease [Oscillospiraceae bacterium]|nr:amino acid permease [Oscillospiraceae bacterium]
MEKQAASAGKSNGLQPYLSPLAVWALSVGSAIGWGSLVVTSQTYLSQAGPMGSILGLLIGFVMMLMVANHYHFLANRYPGTGGLYNYVKYIFGYDRAFLVSWFMFLVYIAIFWANATSIPLFTRYFLKGVLRFGYLYTVFGYEVYLGEVLATLAVIWLVGILCMKSKKATARCMEVLVLVFTVGITVCFVAAMMGHRATGMTMEPAFLPDKNALKQVIRIAFISPWAFIGFESVSHSAAEYKFKHSNMFKVLAISLVATTALYIFILLMSISAYPEGCASWLDYIRRLDEFEGIAGLPAFYAAYTYLGNTGVYILMASLAALVLTSLIGMLRTVSRLCYAVAQDGILPERFAHLNDKQIPVNTILLVLIISIPIPFLGRTPIGWIVDTTTIGAIILYGFASAAVFKASGQEGSRRDRLLSGICLVILVIFLLYMLFPSFFSDHTIETETYALMTVWSLIGLLFFNSVIRKDHSRNFGKAIIVWMALLAFIVLMAMTWTERASERRSNAIFDDVYAYMDGTANDETLAMDKKEFIEIQRARIHSSDNFSGLLITGLFGLALGVLLANYLSQQKWEKKALDERDHATTVAFTDPMTGVKSKHAFLLSEKDYDTSIKENMVESFAVVVCDVNGLKKINDTLGHKAGDAYIIKASRMICDIFQHSPVFRTGGDEFVVILTGRDYLIRKELVLALHDRSVAHISTDDVVISGGLSDYIPGKDTSFHDVFERADSLMYEEKQLLKGMGAATREDFEAAARPVFAVNENTDIMRLKHQILIVEDEQVNQMILGNMLSDGFEVLYASDGVEALEQIKAHRDDLAIVLLDLQMPRLSGIEVLKVMKEEKELKDIPVIVMTADQSAEVECLKFGAMDFIPKPYPTAEIVQARVHRCIELSEKRNIIETTERDSLTNLFNLDYFLRYVRMYDQHYTDMPMDAIVLDVNHFHVLNERYGKQYGDSVLARIGARVRQISREVGGVGCRRGADTFLIYCPHREDYEAILDKASDGLVGEDVSENRVRLRLGVYANVDKTLEIERRFDYAKTASNTVKTGYSKAIGIYDANMHEAELQRARLLEDFKPSLQSGRFKVYFQPKFDIRQEKPLLASAEALVRWDHPELGLISPAVFIPLLEDNGLILDLDQFVWREAAARIRDWKDRLGYSVPVSVNVSRIDMLTPNLKDVFRDILAEYRLSADDLALEITESAYTGDSEQVISTAKELRGMGMGFRIEMDDFGTGYSSLGMLSHLPIDALKLDMSFVRSAFGETRDVRMIELIIDIADYLHVPVVAEGVETEEQYLVLKTMGCDMVQGYYFSRPVPPEDFDRFLIERAKERDTAVTPEVRKTYMSISKALTSDFESIFYVDMVTHYYLEFYTDKDGKLEIRPGGTDFFAEAREKLLRDVAEEDKEKVRDATAKPNLMRWIGQEETEALSFMKTGDRGETAYILQTIKTRGSDDHHIVIGVRQE